MLTMVDKCDIIYKSSEIRFKYFLMLKLICRGMEQLGSSSGS